MAVKDPIVAEIQARLNEAYIPGTSLAPLVVDGIYGPKTCAALYSLQAEWGGDTGSVIVLDTLLAIDLTEAHWAKIKNVCKPWYKGTGAPATVPISAGGGAATVEIPPAGAIKGKPISWPFLLLGAALGGGMGYLANKKGIIKKGSPAVLAGAGAGLGALTYWVVQKNRQA